MKFSTKRHLILLAIAILLDLDKIQIASGRRRRRTNVFPQPQNLIRFGLGKRNWRRGACFEDGTAYFGNNIVMGNRNPQPSRLACQQSCSKHPGCEYWTLDKRRHWCYLKTSRAGVTHNRPIYVSGSKRCLLPEQDAGLLVQRRGWQCSKTIFIQ